MSIIFGILLIIGTLILAILFWAVVKAKGMVTGTLKNPQTLNGFISTLFEDRFFDKQAEEVSETSQMWNAVLSRNGGYAVVIKMEFNSSMISFKKPRNILLIIMVIIGLIEYFYLPIIYLFISVITFFILYLVPLSESGERRAIHEVAALSWLMFQWNKHDHEEAKDFAENNDTFKNLHSVIVQLN
jgi:hypothetical protein